MKNIHAHRFQTVLPLCGVIAVVWALLTQAEAARKGMTDALALCGTVMIPSLFPMLIVSQFAASCRCPAALQTCAAKPLRALLGLSPGSLTPLLLGLTCGYPMAARAAASARAEGLITEEDARRLTLYFTCPGIPFAVIVAGGCFRSRAVGWTLLISCVAADLLTAVVCRPLQRAPLPDRSTASHPVEKRLSERLVLAVDSGTKAMLSICAWIGAFSTLCSVLTGLAGEGAGAFLALTAEVSTALRTAAGTGSIPLTAACLSFGGICVCCQLLPDLNACGVGAARFLALRLLSAVLAGLTETALLRLVAVPVPTDTRIGAFYLAADSTAGSVALLFLCAVFMAETAGRCGASRR